MSENLTIPLHLAELLHVTLGTLADELDGHPWAPLARRVVHTYEQARGNSPGITGAERSAVQALEDIIHMDAWLETL